MLSNDMRGQWRETIRSLKDATGGSEEYHARLEILCVCAAFLSLFVFRVLYSPFFRVTRLMKASNSKKSGAGNVRESLLLNHQRFPSGSQRFYRFALSCVVLAPSPTFDPSYTIFFGRSTLRVIFLTLEAPSLRNAPGSQRTRVGYQRRLSEMGLAPIRASMRLRMWSCGTEALRTLDELEIEFPGKNIYSWNLFERVTKYDFFAQQRRSIIHQSHLAPLNNSHPEPECETTSPIQPVMTTTSSRQIIPE